MWNVWQGGNGYEEHGVNYVTTRATDVPQASSTDHVKGNWIEIVPSASTDWSGFHLHIGDSFANARSERVFWDVGVGSAGSEEVIIENIPTWQSSVDGRQGYTIWMPIAIPSGSRVSVRNQSSAASTAPSSMCFITGKWKVDSGDTPTYGKGIVYGVSASNTTFTHCNITGSNAWSDWTLLGYATESIRLMYVFQSSEITSTATEEYFITSIGIDDGATVGQIVQDLPARFDNFEVREPMFVGPFPVDIPSGSKLVARSQCNNNKDHYPCILGFS